jgi:hypothetical protein
VSPRRRLRPRITIRRASVIGDDLPAFDHAAFLYVYVVDGVVVRGVHWSGRYDGAAETLARHLVRLARQHRANYITTTESQQPEVMHVIQEAFADADLLWGTKRIGEYALLYDLAVFAAMPKHPPTLRTLTDTPGRDDWQQLKVGTFNLHHRQVRRWWRILVAHGPSGIELGSGFKSGRQAETAKTGWPKVGKILRRFRRRHPRAVQVLCADCNADHFRSYWRAWFRRTLGAPSVYVAGLPNKGTHHGRLIDVAWIPGATITKGEAA